MHYMHLNDNNHLTKDFQAFKLMIHDVGGRDPACAVTKLLLTTNKNSLSRI